MSQTEMEAEAGTQEEQQHTPATGRVFVTGASGFVGRYTVRQLILQGYEPVCVVRSKDKLSARLPENLRGQVHAFEGELDERDVLDRATENCVAAVHLVGIIEENRLTGQTFPRIHTEFTRAVVASCRKAGIQRYAHMSALGSRPEAPSVYHRTKWEAEEIVRDSGLDWTIFRPSIIHGPDGDFMEMMKYFSTSLMQPVMPYFGAGENQLQPVDVRDVATCFAKCLSMPETIGQIYDMGGPERFTWKALYDVCSLSITGRKRVKVSVPVPVAKFLAKAVMPVAPSILVPYKFNEGQVLMSQEDSICETGPVEKTFGIQLRDFREELNNYAERIE